MVPKLIVCFLLAGGPGTRILQTEQGPGKHPNAYPMSMLRSVGFNYLIYANNLISPENPAVCSRNLYLLLDENAFNEENLKELFAALSDAFPEPQRLSVKVHTSLEQVRPLGPSGVSELPDLPSAHKHHLAAYQRWGDNELFRYIAHPPQGKWTTVILRGVDPTGDNQK